ncbi:type II secretion system protein [Clostridium sp. WILCCON 0269]|uniref:Type II secretion system protein n=1 Tax=Candidatus Clostridium eludens TaxID=3381663 RepID=A0ABW8SMH7_9CLOT
MINIKIFKNYKRRGFTLIELMLVVAIILVLLGFLIPKFSAYQDKVKTTKAISTAKQIETAAMASYGDNEGKFNEEDVQNYVSQLTSAENLQVKGDSAESDLITISYKSDENTYTLEINAADNSCIVKDGQRQIYPKASSAE